MIATHRRSLLVLLLASLVLLGAILSQAAYAQVNETQVRKIGDKIQCPVCEGTSVADSPSPVAAGMRESIREQLAQGKSEKQIIAFFVDVYGPGVLREPPKTGFYSAVWWVPGLAVVAAALIILVALRRQRAGSAVQPAAAPAPLPTQERDAYRKRLRDELNERND
ncbi:MAG: cytochrome c-type biogenesis protein CcmH [Chloroflexi bacterium]|nr:cytochrome c-type biogenesis protein CcmH [Chloroflexota bacterium]